MIFYYDSSQCLDHDLELFKEIHFSQIHSLSKSNSLTECSSTIALPGTHQSYRKQI